MVAPVITIGIVGVLFGILQFLAARRGGSLLENFGAGGWVIAFEVLFAAGVFSGVIVNVLMTPYNVPVDWTPDPDLGSAPRRIRSRRVPHGVPKRREPSARPSGSGLAKRLMGLANSPAARHVYDPRPVGRRDPILGGRQSQREDETVHRARGRGPEDRHARADHLEGRVFCAAPPRVGPPARRHGGAGRRPHWWEETRIAPGGRLARSIERGAPVPATREGAAEVPHRYANLGAGRPSFMAARTLGRNR